MITPTTSLVDHKLVLVPDVVGIYPKVFFVTYNKNDIHRQIALDEVPGVFPPNMQVRPRSMVPLSGVFEHHMIS